MNIIEVNHVNHVYGQGTPFEVEALHDICYGFEKGKITGLIGHTGSGKSTLVQMLNGLVKPTSGEIILDGKNIWDKPKEIRDVRFRCGLVMQYPEYQLFDETVEKDIGYALRNKGMKPEEIKEKVLESARFVGISEDLFQKSPFDLSGGQKRRVAIAGILAMEPEVLILDEPAAGLDPRGRKELLSGLLRYRDAKGASIILVSHSMEDMALYCDNVLVLSKGKVLTKGTVDDVFSNPDILIQSGLDIPQIAYVAKELVDSGIPLEGKLYTVDGVEDAICRYIERRESL